MAEWPRLAADAVVLTDDGFVLVRRKRDPFKGSWALPGGFVEYGETVEEAAAREVKEETGLDVKLVGLVGVYSDPERDPRGHVVSVAFLAWAVGGELKAADDAGEVAVFKEVPEAMAFDHAKILEDGLSAARALGLVRWGEG